MTWKRHINKKNTKIENNNSNNTQGWEIMIQTHKTGTGRWEITHWT